MPLDLRFRVAAALVTLAALTAVPSPSAAENAAAAAQDSPRFVDLTVLLDPKAAAPERLEELAALKANAGAGQLAAICTLGRLGLFGKDHAARLPEFDYGDVTALLNRCVLGGSLDAMLVMAEHEIRQARGLEAMIWAQAYFKLAELLEPQRLGEAASYKAGILARIERMQYGRHLDDEEVLEYVAGFLSSFGERIAAAHRAGGNLDWLPLPTTEQPESRGTGRTLLGRFARDTSDSRDDLAFVTYIVEVEPSGKSGRRLVLEAYPDAAAARRLRAAAIAARYAPSDDGSPRWAYLPVSTDNPDFDLRP
jgi:hypothetical protein